MRKNGFVILLLVLAALTFVVGPAIAAPADKPNAAELKGKLRSMTAADRKAAADRALAAYAAAGLLAAPMAMATPGGMPDYFGMTPNYSLSPQALVDVAVSITDATGMGAAASATVGGVTGITLVSGGSGYTAPKISISGGGYGATASAVVVGGAIVAINLTSPGQLYTTATPTVTITDATGLGASATATAAPGAVTSIAVVSGGMGYSLTPTVTITGNGAGAAASATVDATGVITAIAVSAGGSGYSLKTDLAGKVIGIRKFVDTLPGLTPAGANNLGKFLPVAVADTVSYPGSDYYEIGVVQYTEQMHSDLPPTTLRGYVQLNDPASPAVKDASGNILSWPQAHYLGPVIVAQRNVPVRVKFYNLLPAGAGGDLFIPVDSTVMGAGMGPDGVNMYAQNRATLHLHGGATPWISDGTPHQWTTPAGEATAYPKGVSVKDVPDMPPSGPGVMTFFYTNQQSARLMFYHDHSYGITRLNVYAGEAAGYLVSDPVEQTLINGGTVSGPAGNSALVAAGTIPAEQIPLIIQDKAFVDATTIGTLDPTWNWGTGAIDPLTGFRTPKTGDLWFPHVYMPNQNPYDIMGANNMGRWDYGPWFWPPYQGMVYQPVPNPLFGTSPTEGPTNPGTPNPSLVPEAFVDTPVVNGNAYPTITVQPKAYRLRILNACNDRYLNLSLFYAKSNGDMWDPATGALLDPAAGEVPMVPATPNTGLPASWPTDGRDGGVPDPAAAGPSMIVIGSEGGVLPAPAVIPPTPVGYDYNRRSITVLNVLGHALWLGPAERADVIVDFSQVPPGSKLILYNDAPAPVPAFDPRNDYFTGAADQSSTGGAQPTVAGYGPNTRTIMQIQVDPAGVPAAPYDLNALNTALPIAFAASQEAPIVPNASYDAAYNAAFPVDAYVRIQDNFQTFTPVGQTAPVTMPLGSKAIQELFEVQYGRMNATFGVELPFTNLTTQTTIPYGYIDPSTEILKTSLPGSLIGQPATGDGTQLWKFTHNGVDTHVVHFHMFNVQLINRVGWDGMVKPPDPEELGWKESIKANPLEDIIFALRPVAFSLPFGLVNSFRPLDVTMPVGSTASFTNIDPLNNPVTVTNQVINYGQEYVYHCHLLGHEENDMMRAMIIAEPPVAPGNLLITALDNQNHATLSWMDNSVNETAFKVQRSTAATGPWTTLATVASTTGPATGAVLSYVDATALKKTAYYYQVVASNVVGGVAPGYPSMTADSLSSNIFSNLPTAPINVVATAVQFNTNSDRVTLTWTDTAAAALDSGDNIQMALDANFTVGVVNSAVGVKVTSFTTGNLPRATNFYFRVQCKNASGVSAWTNAAPFPILTP